MKKEGGYFTAKEVVDAVVAFEKNDLPKSYWFGGLDCHRIFFEGTPPPLR